MLVLGFDGGGSNARLALATSDGETILEARAGGVNPMDNAEWRANFEVLFAKVGERMDQVCTAVLGLPGWGEIPDLDREVAAWLKERLPCEPLMLNDVELAQRAAFDDAPGVLLLSGTGSMAVARDPAGTMLRAGGFGDLIGDEGSAFDIGRSALARLSHETDGRAPASPFGARMKDHLRFEQTNETQAIMGWLYASPHPRSAIAAIAAFVDSLSEEGDPVARAILEDAGYSVARLYHAMVQRACLTDMAWSYAGSTFRSSTFRSAVQAEIGHAPTAPSNDALNGALRIAARKSGISTKPS
ncbi:N-acetylglucosamine kinase [Rhizobium sp. NRK18]|uniref:N-acetylglucosamine kinase n=1 Tax=Rhizobium sp. NRK18 TaxID=2964667 RepID=UPI0021C37649|nr:BadF/BadG/BcrA/BcrD ATPase family protein [Rhizobium sp. NRK18]MCQ2006302.1 N-acetylglucosamine kinase [Rhizobium sp. NRK18]